MMYILRCTQVGEYTWNIGDTKPRLKDGNTFDDVCEVYADGRELETIRRRCTNLPDVPSSGAMVWKAPFAQFIYDSLLYEPALIRQPQKATVPRPNTHRPTG
jgi:hypothetical protein